MTGRDEYRYVNTGQTTTGTHREGGRVYRDTYAVYHLCNGRGQCVRDDAPGPTVFYSRYLFRLSSVLIRMIFGPRSADVRHNPVTAPKVACPTQPPPQRQNTCYFSTSSVL